MQEVFERKNILLDDSKKLLVRKHLYFHDEFYECMDKFVSNVRIGERNKKRNLQ